MILRIKEFILNFIFELKYLVSPSKYNTKVFCIGYNKTGTTTIGKALEILGYRNSSFNKRVWREYYKKGKIDKIIRYTSKFDSFDDLPWLKEDMIPLLDNKFPNSKFIYLERDEESWLNSYKNWTYKQTGKYPDLDLGLNNFRKHGTFVKDYFKKRENDILYLNVRDENAFEKLAWFLGKISPQKELPHFNKT